MRAASSAQEAESGLDIDSLHGDDIHREILRSNLRLRNIGLNFLLIDVSFLFDTITAFTYSNSQHTPLVDNSATNRTTKETKQSLTRLTEPGYFGKS